MENVDIKKNAVLGDKELQGLLTSLHPKWGDFVTRVAGEVFGLPLIDQKTKLFLALTIDIVNGSLTGPGTAFAIHVDMAVKQGATYEEIEELFLFLGPYTGLAKITPAFGVLADLVKAGMFPDKK